MSKDIVKKESAALTPMELISTAVQNGATPEQLGQLMDLQDRWEAKQSKMDFIQALSKFRSKCPDVEKDKKAHNSNYATLSHTLSTIKDTMQECGLAHTWNTETTGRAETTEIKVTCIITHTAGHSESSSLSAGIDTTGSKSVIQGIGSTVSYLERYTLYAVLGMTSKEMDNDGWTGPILKTKLKEHMRALCSELNQITDRDTMEYLNGLWKDNKAALSQAKLDLPDFYQSAVDCKNNAKMKLE